MKILVKQSDVLFPNFLSKWLGFQVGMHESCTKELNQQSKQFDLLSKAALREGYLVDTLRLIRRQDFRGLSTLEEAQAAGRRLEALATDVLAREPRFATLRDMAKTIERGNYHSKEQVIKR